MDFETKFSCNDQIIGYNLKVKARHYLNYSISKCWWIKRSMDSWFKRSAQMTLVFDVIHSTYSCSIDLYLVGSGGLVVKCITDIYAKLYFDIYYCAIKTYFSQIHGAVSTSVALDEVRNRDRRSYYSIINTVKFKIHTNT